MPLKLWFTVIGFNGLALIFLAGVVTVYFRPSQFGLMTSLFLGWLTAFINLNSSEAQLPVLLLLAFGFFIGFAVRSHVWQYALILGLFVPVSQFLWLGATHQFGLWLSDGVGSFIAVVPAFGGVYVGTFIGRSGRKGEATVPPGEGTAL